VIGTCFGKRIGIFKVFWTDRNRTLNFFGITTEIPA